MEPDPNPERQPGPEAPLSGGSCIERAIVFDGCQGPVIGVLAMPATTCRAAVLVVAGQPQTRVGAHRMFVDLARALAEHGVASLRFDVGGWGDSPGDAREFERSAPDIAAAMSLLRSELKPGTPVQALGLCDGASAAVLALSDLRAAGVEPEGLCLINPWVRSDDSLSEAMVKHYYLKRLFEGELWKRLLMGRIPLRNLLLEPLAHVMRALGLRSAAQNAGTSGDATRAADASADAIPDAGADAVPDAGAGTVSAARTDPQSANALPALALPALLLAQLQAYRGRVVTVLSGNDLTAAETESLMRANRRWRQRLEKRGVLLRVAGADHTFSNPSHWDQAAKWIAEQAVAR